VIKPRKDEDDLGPEIAGSVEGSRTPTPRSPI
jgi:hypothetical protein